MRVFIKALIILVICIIGLSLAVHFLTEVLMLRFYHNIQDIGKQMGKQLDHFHEHSEDLFIFMLFVFISPLFIFSPIKQPIFPDWVSFTIELNLPPPNR